MKLNVKHNLDWFRFLFYSRRNRCNDYNIINIAHMVPRYWNKGTVLQYFATVHVVIGWSASDFCNRLRRQWLEGGFNVGQSVPNGFRISPVLYMPRATQFPDTVGGIGRGPSAVSYGTSAFGCSAVFTNVPSAVFNRSSHGLAQRPVQGRRHKEHSSVEPGYCKFCFRHENFNGGTPVACFIHFYGRILVSDIMDTCAMRKVTKLPPVICSTMLCYCITVCAGTTAFRNRITTWTQCGLQLLLLCPSDTATWSPILTAVEWWPLQQA